MTTGLLDLDEQAPPRLAGVGVARRGLARVLDLGLLQVLSAVGALHAVSLAFPLEVVFGPAAYASLERLATDQPAALHRLLDVGWGILGLIAMHTFGEGLHGSTIGKRLCGITVVSDDGGPAGMMAAFRRSVGFLVDQMFFGLVGAHFIHNDPKGQRLGDRWADTMVVRIDALEPSARRSTGRFVLATVVGLVATAAVAFVVYGAQIVYGARAAAADRVEILEVVLLPDQQMSPGGRANFRFRVRHDLHSAPHGTVSLLAPDSEWLVPIGDRVRVSRGGATTIVRERLSIPAEPAAPGLFIVSLAVGLYPAQNKDSASHYDDYLLELVACDSREPDRLCVREDSRP